MIAVLAGATGLVGSYLLQNLLADPQISKVISVGRRSSQISNHKLQEITIGDLSEIKQQASSLKGDLYFCALGTTIAAAKSQENFQKVDEFAVIDFASIAKLHDAKAFALVSASGANSKSSIFYNQVKGRTEEALKSLNLKHLIVLRPSLLLGDRQAFRFLERMSVIVVNTLSPILPVGLRKALSTKAEDVAIRMLQESKKETSGITTIEAKEI